MYIVQGCNYINDKGYDQFAQTQGDVFIYCDYYMDICFQS